MKKFWLPAILVFFFLFALAENSYAQGNEIYTLTHLEGAAEKKDIQSSNMGGVYAPNPDPLSGNPASLGLVKKVEFLYTTSGTRFDNGIQLNGTMYRFYTSFELFDTNVGFMVGTNRSRLSQMNLVGNIISGFEDDKVIGLGFETIKNLYFGVNYAPEMSSQYNIRGQIAAPPFPVPAEFVTTLRSGVVTGGSYGLLYSNQNLHLGLDYRAYRENVWNETDVYLPFGFGTLRQRSEESFDSQRWQIGVLWNVSDRLDLTVGFFDSRFKSANGNYELNYNKLQFGAGYEVASGLELQAGSNGNGLTAGFTYKYPVGKDKKDRNLELGFGYQRDAFFKELQIHSDSWEASARLRF